MLTHSLKSVSITLLQSSEPRLTLDSMPLVIGVRQQLRSQQKATLAGRAQLSYVTCIDVVAAEYIQLYLTAQLYPYSNQPS